MTEQINAEPAPAESGMGGKILVAVVVALVLAAGAGYWWYFSLSGQLEEQRLMANIQKLVTDYPTQETPEGAIFRAIMEEHLPEIEPLLQKHPEVVNTKHRINGATPLHAAASRGQLEMMNVLLKHGANTSAIDRQFNTTPIGWAVVGGHPDAVKLLLDHGVKPDAATFALADQGAEFGFYNVPVAQQRYEQVQAVLKQYLADHPEVAATTRPTTAPAK